MEPQIVRYTYQDKELILVPTAHVSKNSAELVRHIIEQEQPDSICVELDQDRYDSLKQKKKWEDTSIIDIIKQGKAGYLLINLVLSNYQKKLAENLNSNSGQEMIEGIKAAEERNIPLVLADRSIQTTFTRIWRTLSFWDKIKLLTVIITSIFDTEEVSEEDLLVLQQEDTLNAALQEVTKEFPRLTKVLVHERDQYLAYKVKHAPGKKVVAILGAAHIIGMQKLFEEDYAIEPLDEIPAKSFASKIAGWILPISLLVIIALTFTQSSEMAIQQIVYWSLWCGCCAALGSICILAHPLTILTSFLVAPITCINPILAAGWFAGLCEAYIRKPTVKDSQDISNDIQSLRGFFKNKITKILLVVIFANIGSSIGNIIGSLTVVKTFFETLF